ncbi:MAG: SulP family inorganic anion transporter [Paracoccaceae bacterium]|nr:SulP family inorganic anion transporter [Paracoccaceae bacterium]
MNGRQRPAPRLFFPTLRGMRPAALPGEMVAALILLAIAVPEQLATARLMGMAPVTGLIAFGAGTLAFAAFGLSRAISVGADSTIAPIMAATIAVMAAPGSPDYAALAGMLATLIGLMLIAARPLRLGWIADLLSVPVTTGFLAGISVHVIAGALPEILSVSPTAPDLPGRLWQMARALPSANVASTALGLMVAAVSLGSGMLGRRVPGPLIGIALAAGAVQAMGLTVPMLAPLPHSLPFPRLMLPRLDQAVQLLPLAVVVALVVMMQTAAVRQALPDDGDSDPGRDFAAIGLGSLFSALLGGFAVNASPPRSAMLAEAGTTSQASGLIAVALTAGLVVFGAQGFALLPRAALGGILLMVGLHLLHLRTMRQIARESPPELLLTLAAALLVIVLPVNQGVWLAIMLSLAHALYAIARPATAVLERVPGTTIWWALARGEKGESEPGILVFALGAPVNFFNAREIEAGLLAALRAAPPDLRLIVLEATAVIGIDYTGARILRAMIERLRAEGLEVALARLESPRAALAARRTGLLTAIGEGNVFHSVEEAIRQHRSRPSV